MGKLCPVIITDTCSRTILLQAELEEAGIEL